MVLVAKKNYVSENKNQLDDISFKHGDIFKGWYDGDSTVYIENKIIKFECHIMLISKYFIVFGEYHD